MAGPFYLKLSLELTSQKDPPPPKKKKKKKKKTVKKSKPANPRPLIRHLWRIRVGYHSSPASLLFVRGDGWGVGRVVEGYTTGEDTGEHRAQFELNKLVSPGRWSHVPTRRAPPPPNSLPPFKIII